MRHWRSFTRSSCTRCRVLASESATAFTMQAELIQEMCAKWHMRAEGAANDSIFSRTGSSAGTIAAEFARCGVCFYPARKNTRIASWTFMRRLLADVGKPDRAGLYVSRNCSYWWKTAPFIGRDPRRIEDIDSRGNDHGCDALRYGSLRLRRIANMTDMFPGNR